MPRSTYIYVLRCKSTHCLFGAWTVKKELARWLSSGEVSGLLGTSDRSIMEASCEVVRFRDGQQYTGVVMSWDDIPQATFRSL